MQAFTTDQPPLVQLLLKRGLIKQEDLKGIREAINRSGDSPETALLTLNIVSETDIATAYSEEFVIPLADSNVLISADKDLAEMIGESVCRENSFVPLGRQDDTIKVALANPTDLKLVERIQLATGLVPQMVIATFSMIDDSLGEIFGTRDIVNEIASEGKVRGAEQPEDGKDEEIVEVMDLDNPIAKGATAR